MLPNQKARKERRSGRAAKGIKKTAKVMGYMLIAFYGIGALNFAYADIDGVHESVINGVITLTNAGSHPSRDTMNGTIDARSPNTLSVYMKKIHGVIELTDHPSRPGYALAESLAIIPDSVARRSLNLGNIRKYRHYVNTAALKYHVNPKLINAVISAESGFNSNAVSSKGADGLMQLMPETASRFGVQNVFNPRENIDGGVAYLAHLETEFHHRQRLVIAAYNAGGQSVINAGYHVPDFAETRNYVPTVLAYEQKYAQ